MKHFITGALLLMCISVSAQEPIVIRSDDNQWKKIYRASATKINDLVHTKLDLRPDYKKCYLYGKAWITLHPHFYPTDSLRLDAKGMNINQVALISATGQKTPLKYDYKDSLNLYIKLNKTYKAGENYTIFIDYVSKPNEYKAHGSAAITDAKGLYFINPDGSDKEKPTQLWTQGETEGSSVWFPTIDRPNQKTTDEIILTVPSKYVTLSNGYLAGSKKNADGTRTDDWKMTQPHAPYLFFFGVGDYSIIRDKYKNKEVNYYVEPAYASVARKIFGNTPQMIAFYSKILGIDYPWIKYSQMTARDYVSGAMENTTATLHTDALQQNARQLTDGNQYEEYVAHELFHQWFGDLVTTESWSNLTVNESFANYSETLWDTYKYGKDAGDQQNYTDMIGYLRSNSQDLDLVRFYYKDKEDMFDAVSYNKGGRILHMLRHYVGDSAFFKSLNLYLNQNKYGTGEAHQLRLAFEQITGQDMNWFFNQWYFGSGHPVVDIRYAYDQNNNTATVVIEQKQKEEKIFKMPVDIDIYTNGAKKRYTVWMQNKTDSFSFPVASRPDLINVDGDKIMLWEKTDHKSMAEFDYQLHHAASYVDRREAIAYAFRHAKETGATAIIEAGLKDKFHGLRSFTLRNMANEDTLLQTSLVPLVEQIATNDDHRTNRAAAISILGNLGDKNYEPIFLKGTADSSYSIAGASLAALYKVNPDTALGLLPLLEKDARGSLKQTVSELSIFIKTDADYDEMYNQFKNASGVNDEIQESFNFLAYLSSPRVKNIENFKKGVDAALTTRDKYVTPYPQVADIYKNALNGFITSIRNKTTVDGQPVDPAVIKAKTDYLQSKL